MAVFRDAGYFVARGEGVKMEVEGVYVNVGYWF